MNVFRSDSSRNRRRSTTASNTCAAEVSRLTARGAVQNWGTSSYTSASSGVMAGPRSIHWPSGGIPCPVSFTLSCVLLDGRACGPPLCGGTPPATPPWHHSSRLVLVLMQPCATGGPSPRHRACAIPACPQRAACLCRRVFASPAAGAFDRQPPPPAAPGNWPPATGHRPL